MIIKPTAFAALMLAAATFAAPASAAPQSTLSGVTEGAATNVEKADYRRCWYSGGRRHCRIVRGYGYYDEPSYGYGPGYYGYGPGFVGPGFGFSFGGGHRHHGGHRGHR